MMNTTTTNQEEGVILALATGALVIGGVIAYNVARKRNSGVTDYKEAAQYKTSEQLGLNKHYNVDANGLFSTSYVTGSTVGWKNHNPLNIEYKPANDWLGQIGTDGRFARFNANIYGYRAALKLMQNYIRSGHNTITKIVTRWIGGVNNPDYIAHVVKISGIGATQVLSADDLESLSKIVYAMAIYENGWEPDPVIEEIVDAALMLQAGL